MGVLEKEIKKKSQKVKLQKIILGTIYGAGLISTALLAPNAVEVISKLEPEFLKKKNSKYSFNRSLSKLKSSGLVVYIKNEKGSFAKLTSKGEAKLRQIQLHDYKLEKPKHWDGKWRMLIFDIKEEIKYAGP